MLLIWDFDYIKDLIEFDQLIETINNLKLHKAQLSIIIYSTVDQLKYVVLPININFLVKYIFL